MAKFTSIDVIKNINISTSGITYTKPNNVQYTPTLRYNSSILQWEYNNGNQWQSIGAGTTDVFYVNEFPETTNVDVGIYITPSGQAKYNTGADWITLSLPVVSSIIESNPNTVAIPTEKATVDYITNKLLNKIEFNIINEIPTTNLSSNILYLTPSGEAAVLINNQLTNLSLQVITDINDYLTDNTVIPTVKSVVDYVSGVIADIDIPAGEFQHIFYVDSNELPSTLTKNSLYILSNNQSVMIDNNYVQHNLSYKIVNTITNASTNDTIPGTKSVYDYVSGVIANLPVGDLQHIFYVNELPAANNRRTNSIYVLSGTNESIIIDNDNNQHNLSYEIVDAISSESTNDMIPGAKAVYDYVQTIDPQTSNSITFLDIEYGINFYTNQINGTNYEWNDNELIITHNLNEQIPFIKTFIRNTTETTYTEVNIPYTITNGNLNQIILNCSGYTSKLISVKLIK